MGNTSTAAATVVAVLPGLATATATLLLFTKEAAAQSAANTFQGGFALQQFEPAPAGDRFHSEVSAFLSELVPALTPLLLS